MHVQSDQVASFITRDRAGKQLYIIAIDGPGGAGKSHLAQLIADSVSDCQVVHFDDFYLGESQVADDRYGGRFDWRRLEAQLLIPLRQGRQAVYRVFDWSRGAPGDPAAVAPAGTIVVEGVYCTRAEIRHYYDLTVFVEASRETRLRRGMERDGAASRTLWVDVWMPEEELYIGSFHDPKGTAHLIVRGE